MIDNQNNNAKNDFLNQVIDNINIIQKSINNEEDDTLERLLSMDDEQFKVLSPFFLNEIKKIFSESGTQILLASVMNASSLKYEDLLKLYNEIINNIDSKIDSNIFSKEKKDFLKEILLSIINAIEETEAIAKRIISIPIELIDENAKIPTYSNVGDAGADLYALESYTINPGEQVMIRTGIKVAIPYGYAILIQPRSGLSSKTKLRICNTPGLIDSGYRGEICVLMENVDSPIKDMIIDDEEKATGILYGSSHTIEAGDRIAQMRLVEVPTMAFTQVSTINDYESERGEGGFGSTGTK